MGRDSREPAPRRSQPGLCASCRHSRHVVSAKQSQSEFWLCERGVRREPGFVRYPPLPVTACTGWQPQANAAG